MTQVKLYIDEIYWERVQMYVKGHIENGDLTSDRFVLRNLTETKVLDANEVKIDGPNFECRFNIAILDDGNYMPPGNYLLINKQEYDIIAQINPEYLDAENYDLDEEQIEKMENLETNNEKNNYLLSFYNKKFKRGGNSKKKYYIVAPKISREVNEFIFHVVFKKPGKRLSAFQEKVRDIKRKYNKISFNTRNFMFKTIFNVTKFFHLRKGKEVVFTSDSRSHLSGNFEFIYNEMLRQGLDKKFNIHMIFKGHVSERRSLLDKFRFPYLLGKADYIFVDDFHPLLYTVKFKDMQEIIQVWHAVGAFKTVGYSRTGKRGGPFFDSVNHRNYTKAFVSSETDIPYYAEAFGIKERNIIPTGVPRTDVLFDKEYEERVIEQMEEEIPEIKGKKVILFAPTFRGNGHKTAHYPFFKIDFERLAKYCKENNTVVLFKMHPFVTNPLSIPEEYKNYLIDVTHIREVNDILFVTDLLISDYSSLIYEFAVFKRPMLFYAFDLEDYIATRDFYEPYETFVPGKIVESFDELLEAIENNDFEQEKVEPFLHKHFKYTDGRSSERLVRKLFR